MLRELASAISAFVALGGVIGLYINIAKWRRSELSRKESIQEAARRRRESELDRKEKDLRIKDVLSWCNEVISKMVSLRLCISKGPERFKTRMEGIVFDTSILIERGRLFFKNKEAGDYGAHKQPAYRGYRPEILDHILIAHLLADRVASRWAEEDPDPRQRMGALADKCLRKFVSLAQLEVGRSEVRSEDAAREGREINLNSELKSLKMTGRLAG
jgi:hypothetical protein